MLPAISNHYAPGMARPLLAAETHIVLEPCEAWNYAHHPFLTRFRGRLFLCCSSGRHHEDDVGQRVICMGSDDGIRWDAPRVVALPEQPDTQGLLPSGLYVHEHTLTVYYQTYAYDPAALRNGHRRMGSQGRSLLGFRCVTTRDGVSWSDPVDLPAFGGNMAVQRLRSGRLFSCGGRFHAWSGNPDGIHGWQQTEAFPQGWGGDPAGAPLEDDLPGLVSDTRVSLCEGSFIQQDSGRLVMYLRSATPWLWACVSDDEGETWSLPERTDFTDNRTKFCLGRLPDGRYYYVGTPDPFPPRTRHVLALSLSRDGLDWTEHYLLARAQYKGRYPGIDKNGVYGYPSVLVEGDTMRVAFSLNKEMIAVLTADLRQV